ncbi:MAG: hypothetical protein H7A24_12980 [Leptospiraceae bacterium]|nr:hypothetical protein [Leptospiraceae bacterium]MCP5512791.1 hypothetical protein [Leptospiraceae bacterium]
MPSYEDDYDDEFENDDDFMDEDEGIILACEDCDYRWRSGGDDDEYEDYSTGEMICPMCGSSNVVEI